MIHSERLRPAWASECFLRWLQKRGATSSFFGRKCPFRSYIYKRGGADERRCSDDKSSRWNCGHYTGQRKTHLLRRGDGRRAHRSVRRIRGRPQRSRCHRDWWRTRLFYSSLFHRCAYPPRRVPARVRSRVARERDLQWGVPDKAIALCESMPKPVIAAISGTALAGGFEFALSCDLRIAEDGDYLIGFLEPHLGLVPGAGGTQRLPRTIGTPAALMHILMGNPLTPREAERKGLVHETVSGKALDRAMEIAQRLSLHPPEAVACIKRLVRNSTETPLAEGLALERNLFLKLCISEPALARMRSYVEANVTSPSRSIVVEGD